MPRSTKPSGFRDTWVQVDAFTIDGTTVKQEGDAAVVDRFCEISTSSASGVRATGPVT